jgi:hypothetical protein
MLFRSRSPRVDSTRNIELGFLHHQENAVSSFVLVNQGISRSHEPDTLRTKPLFGSFVGWACWKGNE